MMQRTSSRDSLFSVTSDAPCNEIFHLGEKCRIDANRVGTVAFVGTTSFQPGIWVGLVLEKPEGKNDGSVNDERYFQCAPKHGVFCRPSKLTKLYLTSPMSPNLSNDPASPTASIAHSITSTTAATNKTRNIYARECGFDIGERVNIGAGKVGVLKFLDRINSELYAGVQLDRPLGCCDGAFNGVRYFKCNPLYGIFVKASSVKKCAKLAKPAAIEVRPTKASALRTWRGSQESLNSIGGLSLASAMSPQRFGAKLTGTTTAAGHARDGEIMASLKTCLQEKEAHLERLIKELEQRRSESESLAQKNVEITSQLDELKRSLAVSKADCDETAGKLHDMEQQYEDLTFQLDEAQVNRTVFEAENIELRAQCSELRNKINLTINASIDTKEIVKTADAVAQTDDFAPSSRLQMSERSSDTIQTVILAEMSCQTIPIVEEKPKPIVTHSIDMQTEAMPRKKSVPMEYQTSTSAQTSMVDDPLLVDGVSQIDEPAHSVADIQSQSSAPFLHSTSQTDDIPTPEESTCVIAETQTDVMETVTQPEFVDGIAQTTAPLSPTAETQTPEPPPSTHSTVQTDEAPKVTLNSAGVQTQLDLQHSPSQTDVLHSSTSETQTPMASQLAHSTVQTDVAATVTLTSAGAQTQPNLKHSLSQTVVTPMSEQSMQTIEEPKRESSLSEVQTDVRDSRSYGSQTPAGALVEGSAQTNEYAVPEKVPAISQTQRTAMCTTEMQTDVSNAVAVVETPKKPVTKVSVQTSPLSRLYEHSAMQRMTMEVDVSRPDIVELNVSSLAITSQSAQSNEMEAILREHKDKVKQLDSTVSFLNSIISEQTATIGKLRSELSVRSNVETNANAANAAPAPVKADNELTRNDVIARRRVRLFCDNCEVFDQHNTDDCLKEEENRAEHLAHAVTSPVAAVPIGRTATGGGKVASIHRPFCDHCEAFGHETNECSTLTDPKLASKNSINSAMKW